MPRVRNTANTVRLIAGDLRRRQLQFPDAEGLRPTGDRVRETLFNWLQEACPAANCLDLYAGSGALGIEAISRGAAWLDLVEANPLVARALEENLAKLGVSNARVSQCKAERWLEQANERRYQIVFLDPPFKDKELPASCARLEDSGMLDNNCLIYIEQDKPLAEASVPGNWQQSRSKKAGQVYYYLFRREAR
jgi:16S rRNA (guanine966-N2)-methyltransferase